MKIIPKKIIRSIEDVKVGDILTVLDRDSLIKFRNHYYAIDYILKPGWILPSIVRNMVDAFPNKEVIVTKIHQDMSVVNAIRKDGSSCSEFSWSIAYFKEYRE